MRTARWLVALATCSLLLTPTADARTTTDERVTVTIRAIGRDGSAPNATLMIGRPDGAPFDGLEPGGTPMRNGEAAVTVPPGVLDISTLLTEPATDTTPTTVTLAALPQVAVTQNTTVTLDARPAVPVSTAIDGVHGLSTREQAINYSRLDVNGNSTARTQLLRRGAAVRFFATPSAAVTVGDLEFSVGARHEVPPFRARILDNGKELPVADIARAPRFTGVRDLRVVDGATGDVRGKLALIRHDPSTGRPDSILLAAQQAGAAAVMLYNPAAPGIDAADSSIDGHPDLTVPTLRTTRVGAGQALNRTVRLTGVTATPVVYDLLVPTRSKVPSNARHVARLSDLARIDETFGSHVAGTTMAETRLGRTPLFSELGTSQLLPHIPRPYRRTSYVSARPVIWDVFVAPNAGGPGLYAAPPREYDRGERSTMRWFVPVANSGLPDSDRLFIKVFHENGLLQTCLSPMDNGPDHAEVLADGTYRLDFKRNGEPIGTLDSACGAVEAAEGPAEYELAMDAQRDTPWWKFSTRVRSTWKFRAKGGEGEVMPLVLADLDAPDASALGRVKVGTQSRITLGLRHQRGSTAAPFTSARLEISYDANTWTPLRLASAGNGRYVAYVTHPVNQAGNAVHLRVHVTDAGGGRLTQEVTRAFGLTR